MIVGIGCDIVEHSETKNLNWDSNTSIQSRIFTAKEIELYSINKELKFLAGRFAAKEAVLKCLGTGMQDGIALTDVQILQLKNGAPTIELLGKAKTIERTKFINSWFISISHSNETSVAMAVAERI